MRKTLRTAAFFTAAGLSLLAAIGAAALLGVFLTTPAAAARLAALPGHPWWFSYGEPVGQAAAGPGAAGPLWSLAAALAAAAVALPALLGLRRATSQAPAPIAVFMAVFLVSLCVENLRAASAYLAATDRSLTLAVALSRAVLGGRFLGVLALFLVGLYSLEMKYGRHVLLAAGAFAVASAVAVSVPVDRTVFLAVLMHKLGDEQSLWFATLVLSALVVAAAAAPLLPLGGVPGGVPGRRRTGTLLVSCGSVLLLAGREILSFSTRPAVLACGLAMLAGGTVFWLRGFARRTAEKAEGAEKAGRAEAKESKGR